MFKQVREYVNFIMLIGNFDQLFGCFFFILFGAS